MASVLVIDDDANNRLLLATLIRHAGHTAVEAASGREGITAAEKQPPAAVVVDLSLPDISGAEVIRRLRSSDATKNVKIALYTATQMNAAIEELVELFRVEEVIPKPGDPRELLKTLRRLVEGNLER
ncbi:MAG TPA: response regulator [Candidatus Baltobacteraceae bacterium]|nr:response regulator [Candidatus Baltobacteraceae bacterium]